MWKKNEAEQYQLSDMRAAYRVTTGRFDRVKSEQVCDYVKKVGEIRGSDLWSGRVDEDH